MARLEIIPGQKFNGLTIIEEVEKRNYYRYVKCQCVCGNIKEILFDSLKSGKSKFCGCTQGLNSVHNHLSMGKPTRTYNSWSNMKQRCINPNRKEYGNYGGRGITVCERWMTFENFLADMGERPEGTTLDRIDPNGNYEPNNCRWATPKEQRQNQR